MELILVLDRSGSIGYDMPALLSFAGDLVGEFEISSTYTRVGIVQFNGDADVLLPLSSSGAAISAALGSAAGPSGYTSISDGITAGLSLLGDARPGLPVTMFVVTDGVQTVDGGESAAIAAAGTAKAQGVQLFAVGFGGASFATLQSMASPPTSTHAYLGASIADVRAHFAQNGLCGLAASPLSPPPASPIPLASPSPPPVTPASPALPPSSPPPSPPSPPSPSSASSSSLPSSSSPSSRSSPSQALAASSAPAARAADSCQPSSSALASSSAPTGKSPRV